MCANFVLPLIVMNDRKYIADRFSTLEGTLEVMVFNVMITIPLGLKSYFQTIFDWNGIGLHLFQHCFSVLYIDCFPFL